MGSRFKFWECGKIWYNKIVKVHFKNIIEEGYLRKLIGLLSNGLFIFFLFSCHHQQNIDYSVLTKELDSIMREDQKYRLELSNFSIQNHQDSLQWETMFEEQSKIDSSNLARIIEIIEDVGGYPGKSIVGESGSKVTFFVLQHSNPEIQKQHLNLILEAAENLELKKSYAAMFHDRVLMYDGQPQIYGTQIKGETVFDSLSGKSIRKRYLWPIRDISIVDSLRLWNGLGPLEAYLYEMGLEYPK